MVKAISGVMTVRFKNELVRNITIKLGYANAKVRTDCNSPHSGELTVPSDLQVRERRLPETRLLQVVSI